MSEIRQLPDENNMGFGVEETNNLLDNPNLAAALKKLLEVKLQVMVIPIVKRIVGSMMENMVRKVVKEEFERAQERFFTREKWKSGDEGHITQVRQLELQFLEQVSDPVYTGVEIKGGGGNHLTIALVDPLTGSHVFSGPEASAKVELIVLTKDDDDDADGNFKNEEPEDTGRPLLSRNHIKLKEGTAVLENIKFKNTSRWTKSCKVSLVARTNLHGIIVKEAATEPFLVMDCRSTLYKKHYPPSLSDEVWRLKTICRGSKLLKRLTAANIKTVEDFLRSLNMNPQSLKAILNVSAEKLKAIVDHAQTCLIGENLYLYNSPSCEREASAVFNVVGCLRGLLYEDKYVPVDKLSEDEKVDAHKTMASAFEHLDDAESIENEASIAHFLSRSSNANGADTSGSPGTENAAGNIFEDVELIAEISSPSRTGSAAGSIFGIWKPTDESDNALPSTVPSPMRLSPVYSFGRDLFDALDILPANNMDILGHGIDYPIHSRSASEEFGEHLQFIIEQHSDQRTTASDSQMNGTRVASPSVARQRWRMAGIGIVAIGEMQARKKQRLK